MSTKLLTGILSKTKTSLNSNNFSPSVVACNKNIISNLFMKSNVSCIKSASTHAQRKFLCHSTILSSQQPLSSPYFKSLGSYKSEIPQLQSTFSLSQRCWSNSTDKTDAIPGLGIKNTKSDGLNDQVKSPQDTTTKEGGASDHGSKDGGGKQEGKDTWYSGKNAWKVGLACLGISGISALSGFIYTFGAPQLDAEGKKIEDEFSNMNVVVGHLKRAIREMRVMKKMIQDPSSEKLLPDVLKEPWFQPPYTLVIEMTGILVHPDWTLSTGWRFKKRPGLSYFLQNVGPPLFEIVIYTHEQGFTAYPIIDSMDPEGRVMYRLFRDATKYVNGAHVKDLSFLNRDLSKVIMVDCDPKAMSLQPRNGLLIKKWTGDDSDRRLIDLANFLKTIALSEVEDVRGVMEYYAQFDDPLAVFKEKQKQLQQLEEEKEKLAQASKNKPLLRSGLTRKF